jgi:hypothetical protein
LLQRKFLSPLFVYLPCFPILSFAMVELFEVHGPHEQFGPAEDALYEFAGGLPGEASTLVGPYSFSTDNADYYEASVDGDYQSNAFPPPDDASSPVAGGMFSPDLDQMTPDLRFASMGEDTPYQPKSLPVPTAHSPGPSPYAAQHAPLRQNSLSDDILSHLLQSHPEIEAVDLFERSQRGDGSLYAPSANGFAALMADFSESDADVASPNLDGLSDAEAEDERDFVREAETLQSSSSSSDEELDSVEDSLSFEPGDTVVLGVVATDAIFDQLDSRHSSRRKGGFQDSRKNRGNRIITSQLSARSDQYAKGGVLKNRRNDSKSPHSRAKRNSGRDRTLSRSTRRRREREADGLMPEQQQQQQQQQQQLASPLSREKKTRRRSNAGRSQHNGADKHDAYFRFQEVLRISHAAEDDEDGEVDIC